MEELGKVFYDAAEVLFEQGQYESAVETFIKAFQMGVCREEILQIFYDCFITPNEDEFFHNYQGAREGITEFPYEKLALDFIPVSDTKFYILDKEEKKFYGSIDLEKPESGADTVECMSLLVADVWDVRTVADKLTKESWNTIYVLLNENKEKFYSFMKLPGFAELYLPKAVCFESLEIMQKFFRAYPDIYLPRCVVSRHQEKYIGIIDEIHQERIKDVEAPRKNILLSVCIPSYNRGHLALASVLQMLRLPFDSEIEIIVSDNGSDKYTEEYKQIKNLNDSRIKYVRLEENQGLGGNVCHVLSHARGHFAMLASDEDRIKGQLLQPYLSYLLNHYNASVLGCEGIGTNFMYGGEETVSGGLSAVLASMDLNYITGVTVNMDYMRQHGVFDIYQKWRGNVFLEIYPHIIFALLASRYGEFCHVNMPLWTAGEEAGDGEETWGTGEGEEEKRADGFTVVSYMWPGSRIGQLNGFMEIIYGLFGGCREVFEFVLYQRICKTYFLVSLVAGKKHFLRRHSWEESCGMIYKNSMELCELYHVRRECQSRVEDLYEHWINEQIEKETDAEG